MIIILSFLILSLLVNFYYTKGTTNSKGDIKEEKKIEIGKFSGIFEVHITIDPKDNYVNLIDYVMNTPTETKMKPVFAVSQSKNNQYMLSYFTKRDKEIDVIRDAKNVANNLLENDIEVIRVKVEGHNLANTPQTDEQYLSTKKYLLNHYGGGNPYFEFHVKINKWKINSKSNFKNIEEDIKGIDTLNQIGISYNLFSKNLKPLLTIRVYDNGFIEACKYKDKILSKMRNKGYVFDSKIQQEFSLYDSNSDLDKGWLY